VVTERMREGRAALAKNRQRAKDLRHLPTEAEKLLWSRLRAHRFESYKFRRQYLIGNYVADFICLEKKLIVERDGGEHRIKQAYDKKREALLTGSGFRLLRFENCEVMHDIERVLRAILQTLRG
jgi:leucyl-tRNA synthetase